MISIKSYFVIVLQLFVRGSYSMDFIDQIRTCGFYAKHYWPHDEIKQNQITFKFCAKENWDQLLINELSTSENDQGFNKVLRRSSRNFHKNLQCRKGCQRQELLVDWRDLEKRLYGDAHYHKRMPELPEEYFKSYDSCANLPKNVARFRHHCQALEKNGRSKMDIKISM